MTACPAKIKQELAIRVNLQPKRWLAKPANRLPGIIVMLVMLTIQENGICMRIICMHSRLTKP